MGGQKVVAIIQARMGSSRLPGKVLMRIAGKPILWHIIHRLRRCRLVDMIVVATSDRPGDDPLAEFARQEGIEVVRGPEDNVLQRFALAVRQVDPNVIVRVTGDAPLIDPETLDRLVETLINDGAEYCIGEERVDCAHEGFCAFSRGALNRLLAEAAADPVATEHVTGYFKEHPESFDIAHIAIPLKHRFKGGRFSIDTPSDMRFMEEIYRRLAVPAGEADLADVLQLLRQDPDLLQINSHVYQKKAVDRPASVLFRCEGDENIGLGHAVRCLALANALRENYGCGITFAMARGESGMELVRESGFRIADNSPSAEENVWLSDIMQLHHPDALVLDVRNGVTRHSVRTWRNQGILVVDLDDPEEKRLEADLVFYPPVPQVRRMDWTGFSGELCTGWEWVLLRQEFAAGIERISSENPRIMVAMGGSDPHRLTFKAIRALESLSGAFEVMVIIGLAFTHREELDLVLRKANHPYHVLENVNDMGNLMAKSDLAIASFGMTAYELAARGVPSILMSISDDHAESASIFADAQMAVSLGRAEDVSDERLTRVVHEILKDERRRAAMSRNGRKLVDGCGVERIARAIHERLTGRQPMKK